MSDMDPACNFLRDYVPSEEAPDAILLSHLNGCVDCKDQVVLVDARRPRWSYSFSKNA